MFLGFEGLGVRGFQRVQVLSGGLGFEICCLGPKP